MATMKNFPRLGKTWIPIGMVRTEDVALVKKTMQRHKIVVKIEGNTYHAKSDARHGQFREIFVMRGHRREAIHQLKLLFSRGPQEDA